MSDLVYDATRTALLVVDPYNDFISEGGKLYELCRETIVSQDCVTHMREVLAVARAAGLLVCYAPHHRWRPGDYETWHYTAHSQASVAKNEVFAADTWGGTFHPDFQPALPTAGRYTKTCSARDLRRMGDTGLEPVTPSVSS